jgi:hypothetical protein
VTADRGYGENSVDDGLPKMGSSAASSFPRKADR